MCTVAPGSSASTCALVYPKPYGLALSSRTGQHPPILIAAASRSVRLYVVMCVRTPSPAYHIVVPVLAFALAGLPSEEPAPAFTTPESAPTPTPTAPLRRPALKRAHHPLHATVAEASHWTRTRACAHPPPSVVSVVGVRVGSEVFVFISGSEQ
ncbi:hypothetical protein K438DRAFT_1993866 [Mycena galopus ATCC 62051]|nr:hypothetical protein K438DRAFT_1993866 [Mycena galopus ATCC 62051]